MSRSPREPHEPEIPLANESSAEPVTWESAAEKEKDLLLQIYSSFGIEYDQLTGKYRVRL